MQPTVSVKTAKLFAFYISYKDLLDAHTSDMTRTHEQCIKNCNVLSLRNDVEVKLNFVHFEKVIFVHSLSSVFFFFPDCMVNSAFVLCSNFFLFTVWLTLLPHVHWGIVLQMKTHSGTLSKWHIVLKIIVFQYFKNLKGTEC